MDWAACRVGREGGRGGRGGEGGEGREGEVKKWRVQERRGCTPVPLSIKNYHPTLNEFHRCANVQICCSQDDVITDDVITPEHVLATETAKHTQWAVWLMQASERRTESLPNDLCIRGTV